MAGSPTASGPDPHGSFANEADGVPSAMVFDPLTRPDGSGGTQPALAAHAGLPQSLEGVSMKGSEGFSTPVPGSGPFVLQSNNTEVSVLNRDGTWWGPRSATDHIELRAVPDTQARAAAVTSGQPTPAEA